MDLAIRGAPALAFSKQSSATEISNGRVSTCEGAWGVTGDFATPALALDRLGSLAGCFGGGPWGDSCLLSILGFAFTGAGWRGCGGAARGICGLTAGAGCDAGKEWPRGLGAGAACWRYGGSTNRIGASAGGRAGCCWKAAL